MTAANYPSIVLVTGASAGLGAAMVRRFVRGGARVIAAARREDRLQAMAEELGESLWPLPLDVASSVDLEAKLGSIPAEFADVDCLINNAGLALGMSRAFEADAAGWEQMIATNCQGLVSVTRSILPGMVARARGHVVNLGSVAGTYPYPGANVYGATKAFVRQFSLNLQSDLLGTGVRVTCLEPGMCGGTEFSKVRLGGDAAKADALYSGMQPLTANDIADAVEWAVTRAAHVNINLIELMPVDQSFGPFAVQRN